ncbi:MAG: helix-turn-helix domain-containing protein [Bdellovibrionales bacterium]|nr:helix-turn-helix domain-containing protein [Bdellovibrionales bacterium]
MEAVKDILSQHTIVVLNEALKKGFTQIPNYVLRNGSLSFGARLTFAMLLSYAWQKDSCFPGQARLAQDLGITARSLRTYLGELRSAGLIDWKQQGLNKTNIYYILDHKPLGDSISEAERKPASGQERKTRTFHGWKQSASK